MTSRLVCAVVAIGAILTSSLAGNAADLRAPYKAPAYVGPAFFSWSGFYVGINGGYGFGKSNWTATGGGATTGDFNMKGPLAGGTIGYNFQTGVWVWGVEADADYSWIKGSTSTACGGPCETSAQWLATGRGRIGYAWDRWMPYITGGAALGNVKMDTSGLLAAETKSKLGWTAGVGVEYAFLGSWSTKIEYLYVDLGNVSCAATTCGVPANVKFNANLVRLGLNYRF